MPFRVIRAGEGPPCYSETSPRQSPLQFPFPLAARCLAHFWMTAHTHTKAYCMLLSLMDTSFSLYNQKIPLIPYSK